MIQFSYLCLQDINTLIKIRDGCVQIKGLHELIPALIPAIQIVIDTMLRMGCTDMQSTTTSFDLSILQRYSMVT